MELPRPDYPIPTLLTTSTLDFVGRTIFCQPVYGWGWSFFDGHRFEDEQVPLPFHFHLLELFKWHGVLCGGFGIVAEIDHRYHGQWVSFYQRSGVSDLLNNGNFSCNVSFYRSKPSLRAPEEDPELAEHFPLLDIYRKPGQSNPDHLAFGFGNVAADEDVLLLHERMTRMKFLPAGRLPY